MALHDARLRDLFAGSDFYAFDVFADAEVADVKAEAAEVLAYWRSKCRGGALPRRADIRPEELKAHLPHLVLMNVAPAQQATPGFRLVTRLIGTHVAAHFGELTEMDIADMPNAAAAERIYYMAGRVIAARAPLMSRVRGIAPEQTHLTAYALYMPLRAADSERIALIFVHVMVELASRDT